MIPSSVIALYRDVLKYKFRILRWYTFGESIQARIYFETLGFDPDDPYDLDRRIISWTMEKQI